MSIQKSRLTSRSAASCLQFANWAPTMASAYAADQAPKKWRSSALRSSRRAPSHSHPNRENGRHSIGSERKARHSSCERK